MNKLGVMGMTLTLATRFLALVLAAFFVLTGCSSVPKPPQDGKAVNLDSIVVGSTTRDSVIRELGPPSASFEQNGILTYRLAHHPEFSRPYVVPLRPYAGWSGVKYSLVLTFDWRGVLDGCSFVEVKEE